MLYHIRLGDLYWWSGYPCVFCHLDLTDLTCFSILSVSPPLPFQGPFITVLLECSLAAWYLRQTQTNSNQFYIRLNPEVSPYKHSLTGRPRLDYEYRIPFIIVVYNTFFVALYLSNLKTTSSRLSFSPTTYLSFPQILPLPAISKTSSGFRVTSEVGVRMLSKSFRSKGHMKADR